MKSCIKCGAQIDDNAKYCEFCGQPQFTVTPTVQTPVNRIKAIFKKVLGFVKLHLKPIIIIAVILVLLIVGGAVHKRFTCYEDDCNKPVAEGSLVRFA
jgi:uncharacterized membrane protein YvbJ